MNSRFITSRPDFLILSSFFSDFIPMGEGVCQKVYPCCYCQKPLPSPSALREHELIHTGEKPFSCEVCGKGFTRKRNKKAHMIMHLEWILLISPLPLVIEDIVWYGGRIHSGKVRTREKPFSCEVCGKGFTKKRNKKTHMIMHLKWILLTVISEISARILFSRIALKDIFATLKNRN